VHKYLVVQTLDWWLRYFYCNVFVVTEDKSVTELDCPEGSQIVLDVWNNMVVCTRSSLKSPPNLVLSTLPAKGCVHGILWLPVTNWQSSTLLDNLTYHYMPLTQEEESQASCSKSVM